MQSVKYGMVIDVKKCVGCYNCFLACKDEHVGNEHPGYSAAQPMTGHFWIKLIERERGKFPKVKMAFIPLMCMHCEDAPCVKFSKDGSVYRRADGIVIIDSDKAKGKKEILNLCPYRVIYWNEEKNLPQKCTFCAHLLDQGWKEPRCVEACPTGALIFGDLKNPNSEIVKVMASNKTEVLHPEYNIKEKVVYMNLPKKFIAGTVIYGDTEECAENVAVFLKGDGISDITTKTNIFGDFEFENLPENTKYTVKIEVSGYKPIEVSVKTTSDVYIGEIMLEK